MGSAIACHWTRRCCRWNILSDQLVAIDMQLKRLEQFDPRLARVVEYRFFSGMSIEETAHVLESSPATVKRDWSLARAWLHREARRRRSPSHPS